MPTVLVSTLVNSLVRVLIIYLFFDSLLFKRVKRIPMIIICAASALMLFIFSILTIIYNDSSNFAYAFLQAYSVLCASVIINLAFRTKWYNYIVLSLVFHSFYLFAIYFTAVLTSFFSLTYTESTDFIAFSDYFFNNALINMVMFVIVMIIRIKKHKLFEHTPPKNAILMILTPISTIGILTSLKTVFITITNESYTLLVHMTAFCFLLMLSNIAVFYYMDNARENADNANAIHAANQLIKAQTDKYNEMLKNRDIILKLQHDYKNLFLGLVSSLDENNIETVKENLKIQYEELTSQTPVISNGNIFQTMIDMNKDVLKSNSIDIEMECKNLDKNCISNIDLAIIFGNALDNAIEACMKFHPKEKKVISIQVHYKYNTLVMIMKNPVKRKVNVEYLQTTKDVFGHGYGILSMKNIAMKYNGEIHFDCTSQQFTVYITMRNILMDSKDINRTFGSID